MKKTTIGVAIAYCLISITFALTIFYGGMQLTPLGKFSKLISLTLLLPAVFAVVYLKRKSNGGLIGGKEAVREGLYLTLLVIGITLAFEYIFYLVEIRDYTYNLLSSMSKEDILKEARLRDKTITMNKAVANQIVALRYMSFGVSGIVIPYLVFGMFSSFVSAVFMKRG